ncbi:GTPase [Acidianus sp. HS-5]|uniref:NOG1 family protein n=1 Tax=Acidianus sp. HS-5 TaxID=2886040 RepID=UPI001F006F6F|nr:GTPase [Acidianus sp. HS-5]BDC19625.1 GTP-binding protein [Acidianus sp. HS-5]
MLNPFEKLNCPPKAEDLIKIVLGRLPKISGNSVKDREIRRLMYYDDQVKRYLNFVNSFPRIEDLHPFYKEALEITAGKNIDDLKICLSIISRTTSTASLILKKYITEIKRSDESIANKLMRQAFGRVSSLLRKRKDCIDWIIDITKTMKKMKSIDPEIPTVIISGSPNVGKSTLVSKISSAKPEIANYPFTTKEIHVGHFDLNGIKVQVIDTPGILDRPMKERNQIERKAINAIKNLKGLIVFLFDISQQSLYSPKEQFDLLKEIMEFNKNIIITLNKIDSKDEKIYEEVNKILKENNLSFMEISAENNIGLDTLKIEITKRVLEIVRQ